MQAAYTASHAAAVAHPSVIAAVLQLADKPSSSVEHQMPSVEQLTAHCTIHHTVHAMLFRSEYNVRPQAEDMEKDVADLLPLIRSQGVLQNLIGYEEVVAGVKTGRIGIVAGDRRMFSVGFLIASGEWPHDYAIPVMIVSEAEAVAVSLAENSGRKAMHHAEISAAMLTMHNIGASVADIAVCFGVDDLVVRRRLRLANVSPALFKLYRSDVLSFAQMTAYALTDDHAKQESVFQVLGKSGQDYEVRRLLTENKISVSDYLVEFVGLKTFKEANGVIETDLFSDSGAGYISDVPLLHKLANEKMQKTADELKANGAAWVDCRISMTDGDLVQYAKPRFVHRDASEAEQAELDALAGQIETIDTTMDELADNDADESPEYAALGDQMQALIARKDEIEDAFSSVVPEDKELAGAVVYQRYGKLNVLKDVIRPGDKEKMVKIAKGVATSTSAQQPPTAKPVHTDALTKNLTSHRTLALQAELMQRPDVAIVVATHALVCREFSSDIGLYSERGLSSMRIERAMIDADAESGKASAAIDEQRGALLALLPKKTNPIALFGWLMEQEQSVVWNLFAFCTARSVSATLERETTKSAAYVQLAQAVELDMTKYWEANETTYFGRVSKDRMMTVVTEAVNADCAKPMEKMKKGEAANAATVVLKGSGWLPEMLRVA